MSFSMKTIPVQDAVGTILCQDITRIVPGQYKGPVFRKGHVVTEEDIPVLLDVGKEHLYVYRPEPGMVHEEDAAWRIARCVGGANLVLKGPKEGRIDFVAECDGLVDLVRRVDGCEVALFLKEVPGGKVRGNLRAKSDRDISAIAREMGGGGHPAAAGFTVEGDIDQALSTVLPKLRALYVEPPATAEL